MKSTEIQGITDWHQWSEATVNSAPRTSGVYVFRLGQAVRRLTGESEIVYIGTTGKGASSVKNRLRQHLAVRENGITTGNRLRRIANEVGALEVAWISFADHQRAQWFESELFARYAADHIELPPLNRHESGIRLRRIFELIELLPVNEQAEILAKARPRNCSLPSK